MPINGIAPPTSGIEELLGAGCFRDASTPGLLQSTEGNGMWIFYECLFGEFFNSCLNTYAKPTICMLSYAYTALAHSESATAGPRRQTTSSWGPPQLPSLSISAIVEQLLLTPKIVTKTANLWSSCGLRIV
jgi:hypothetical protein